MSSADSSSDVTSNMIRLSKFLKHGSERRVRVFSGESFSDFAVDRHGNVLGLHFMLARGWENWSSGTDLAGDLSTLNSLNDERKELSRYRHKDLRPPRASSS